MSVPIYLIGFRGSGKTTIGYMLSKHIKCIFKDTDNAIQEKYNKTISEIVHDYGWNKFRKIESKILKEVTKKDFKVIATGGGIILNKENRIFMRDNGKVFYLNVTSKVLKNRLLSDPKKTQRPLLNTSSSSSFKEDFIKEIYLLLPKRNFLYEKTAHFIINAVYTPDVIIKNILKLL